MDGEQLLKLFLEAFDHEPTPGQHQLIHNLTYFVNDRSGEEKIFLVRGYAGTGKTSVVSALVRVLTRIKRTTVLLAPTGRAAKVLSGYSHHTAYTIHKKIYRPVISKEGNIRLTIQANPHKDAIFVVDEASMIPGNIPGDLSMFSMRNLLDDLMQYVFTNPGCKLVLIGDNAQLPPVGLDESPALDVEYLKKSYPYQIREFDLDEVVRQSYDSGILSNATNLREKMEMESYDPPFFRIGSFPDIQKINGYEFEEYLGSAFSRSGKENSVVICRSNKRANRFNQEIRNRILFQEDEISSGDFLMVVRNNYHWLDPNSRAGFIANGDILELLSVRKITELYGFRFADVTVRMPDYPDMPDFDCMILLNTIHTETPALSTHENRRLFDEVIKDYEDIPERRKKMEKVRQNPYYNALQVKFAYALTCHKTQGGQWENVFVEQGYLTDEMLTREFLRWLYTAVTRATTKLFLVNFRENMFEE